MASPVYRSDDPDAPIRLAVLADSLAFTGSTGPLLPDDPVLFPNVIARALEDATGRRVASTVLAHPGNGVREAWHAVTKDRHAMFEVLMRADAVVVAVGSFDHAPAGVPPWAEALVPYVRPQRLRRGIRNALRAVHPIGVRLTLGRVARIPAREFERLYDGLLYHVRGLAFGAPGVVLGPTGHRSRYYGHIHPQREARERLQFQIARRHGFAAVAVWPLVEPWAEKLNPDGIHWPAEAHEAVGRAVATPLLEQILGDAPSPGVPGFPGVESV